MDEGERTQSEDNPQQDAKKGDTKAPIEANPSSSKKVSQDHPGDGEPEAVNRSAQAGPGGVAVAGGIKIDLGSGTVNFGAMGGAGAASQPASPYIHTSKLKLTDRDAKRARALQPNLAALTDKLRESRMLFLDCFDDAGVFDVACAVAAGVASAQIDIRSVAADRQSESASRPKTERSDGAGDAAKSAEPTAAGVRRAEGRAGTTASAYDDLTLIDFERTNQPELKNCLLLVEIRSTSDVILPSQVPTKQQVRKTFESLEEYNRYLLFCISGRSAESVRQRLRDIQFYTSTDNETDWPRCSIDPLPYLIARYCPQVSNAKAKAAASELAQFPDAKGLIKTATNWDNFRYLRSILEICHDATDHDFASVFVAELANRQADAPDPEALMKNLGDAPEDKIVRILRFVGCYLSRLEPMEFQHVVGLILAACDREEAEDVARKPQDGKALPKYEELWRRQRAALLARAGLVANTTDGQERGVGFAKFDQELAYRKFFEQEHFERTEYFYKLHHGRAIFASGRKAAKAIASLYALIAVAEPTEFCKSCVPELIDDCWNASDIQFAADRFAEVITALAKRAEGRELVDYVRTQVIGQHDQAYLALNVIDRLSVDPTFDSVFWLRSLLERSGKRPVGRERVAPVDETLWSEIDARLLNRIDRTPNGPYGAFATIAAWLEQTPPDVTPGPLEQFAERFFVERAYAAWQHWLERRYGLTSTEFIVFVALGDKRAESPNLMDAIIGAVVQPRALKRLDKKNEELSQNLGALPERPSGVLALVLAAWYCLLRDEESAQSAALDAGRLRKAFVDALARHLSASLRDTLIVAWEAYNRSFTEAMGESGLSGKDRTFSIFRDFARNVLQLRRELIARRQLAKRDGADEADRAGAAPP